MSLASYQAALPRGAIIAKPAPSVQAGVDGANEKPHAPKGILPAMRRLPFLLALALAPAGCASNRYWNFTKEYFSGPTPYYECTEHPDGLRLCAFTPDHLPVDPSTVVFFLHYATGDERSVARIGLARGFYARYMKLKKPAPRLYSVSYGTHWVLSREPGQRQVVSIEGLSKALSGIEPQAHRRFLWGMSMGSYNAAVLALAATDTWHGAALTC